MSQQNTSVNRKTELISDITTARALLESSVAMGDSMFGQYAHADVAQQVNQRREALLEQKRELELESEKKEDIIQRADRDFSDVRDALPDTLANEKVRFIEDYTLLVLWLSYVFMVLAFIVYKVLPSEEKGTELFKALGLSTVFSIFLSLLFYFVA